MVMQEIEASKYILVGISGNVLRMCDIFSFKYGGSGNNFPIVIYIKLPDVFRESGFEQFDFRKAMHRKRLVFFVKIRNQDLIPKSGQIIGLHNLKLIFDSFVDSFVAVFGKLQRFGQINNRKAIPSDEFRIGRKKRIFGLLRKNPGIEIRKQLDLQIHNLVVVQVFEDFLKNGEDFLKPGRFSKNDSAIGQSLMRINGFSKNIGRQHRDGFLVAENHQGKIGEAIRMILHKTPVKQKCSVFSTADKSIPGSVIRRFVSFYSVVFHLLLLDFGKLNIYFIKTPGLLKLEFQNNSLTFSLLIYFSVKLKLQFFGFIMFSLLSCPCFAQDVSLYDQFNGHYDFVFFGNTLNSVENGLDAPCAILTSSAATLNLAPGNQILKAYLYWAGSGAGDFDVTLNGQNILAERTFNTTQLATDRIFFSAFADVTTQVTATGSGLYTLSDLDLTAIIPDYCINGTNFGGWAIVVLYENAALPLNQINIYDGLQSVPNQLNITLSNLNVIDNAGAKIGFVAWEGDRQIAVNETLTINGTAIGNALNPSNNAFNGTNSFTGSTTLYNMDLDVYDIQGNIEVGDDTAEIQLTSGQDFVMINAVVTKLNSQLPDATVSIDNVEVACDSRKILVDYTVYNLEASGVLPAHTRIAVYADNIFIQSTNTVGPIDLNGSESGQISVLLPENTPVDFTLQFVVDDDGSGHGGVLELNENNNTFSVAVHLLEKPEVNEALPEINACNEGLGKGRYDFSDYEGLVKVNPDDIASFYDSEEDAASGSNPILNSDNYLAPYSPKEIFIRVENAWHCYAIVPFLLVAKNCPPTVYNFVSANEDGHNDDFFVKGLRDIFLNFKLSVYNRWGKLVWTGNNNTPNWTGINNEGYIPSTGYTADGTYFYVLELNDPDYPKPMTGWVYLVKP